ncbi:MAG TPA: SufD family Fe-S cluster assembly protein [Bacilli bacterium]|nr:SufD family Fe-S cluster assembly protein [Bacilli bacterium]HPS18580.1 SufD family Fe-S cluster assembly protein [Bacilli bacterium]
MKRNDLHDESSLGVCSSHTLSLKENEQVQLTIKPSEQNYVFVSDFFAGSVLNITVEENAKLQLSLLVKNNFDGAQINVDLGKNAHISTFFADFSKEKEKIKVSINLNGEKSSASWHLASLAAHKDNKEFEINILHHAHETTAISNNFGVSKDQSKLVFSGCSAILKESHGSKTRQNSKIMVFDPECDAVARPILKIDEKDIEAGHGAVVGRIPEDHLFYLTSRGLDESQAKRLITFGYLKPIVRGFQDESIRDEILSLIERRM